MNHAHDVVDSGPLDVIARALAAANVSELADRLFRAPEGSVGEGFVYVCDARLSAPAFACSGLSEAVARAIEAACPAWTNETAQQPAGGGRAVSVDGDSGGSFVIDPLSVDGRTVGLLGVRASDDVSPWLGTPAERPRVLGVLGRIVDRLCDCASTSRKLHHLNSYLTVSSMLARSVDLNEMLEIVLYCCMDAVGAEAASVLLLDEAKESFEFYRVEGAAKPLLAGTSFPATEGLAGRVLRTQEAEAVNDVQSDGHFYDQIDLTTGFTTRSVIAVPLTAGEEEIGVLEVLNKLDGGPFTADERLLLVSIADEIAFAVRNATLFDFVISSYCKRRQGTSSCNGCERPLDSWTPCVRYREFLP